MSRYLFWFLFFSVFLVSSCSTSRGQAVKSSLPVLEGEWIIQMNQSGGIMGLSRSIDISPAGQYTITDQRTGRNVTGKLGSDELSQLKNIASKSEYVTMESPLPSVCADCFVYDLEISGSGEKFKVQLDDISLPASGMGTLIEYLRNLMDAALR